MRVTETDIREYITSNVGLQENKIRNYEESNMDRLLKQFSITVNCAFVNPAKYPPQFNSTILAEIVSSLAEHTRQLNALMEGKGNHHHFGWV